MYSLSPDSVDALIENIHTDNISFSEWMRREYGAVCLSTNLDSWIYRFDDKEKYAEFCLKWL